MPSEPVREPPRTEHENNLLTDDALAWCERHYGVTEPSTDVLVEAVVALLFGTRSYNPPQRIASVQITSA